jgi:hypothetical protein
MLVQPIQLLPLRLDLNIDVLGDVIDVSHDIFDLLDFYAPLIDDCGHVVRLRHHPDVLIVLYSHLHLVGSVYLAISGEALTLPVGSQFKVVLLLLLDGIRRLVESVR